MSKSDTYKLLFQFYQQICNHASTKRKSSRSEEHTSELQSRLHLVCRLLLEKKKNSYRVWNQQQLPILKRVNINVASYWCPQTVSRMRQPQVAALSAEHTRQLLEASPRGYGY